MVIWREGMKMRFFANSPSKIVVFAAGGGLAGGMFWLVGLLSCADEVCGVAGAVAQVS